MKCRRRRVPSTRMEYQIAVPLSTSAAVNVHCLLFDTVERIRERVKDEYFTFLNIVMRVGILHKVTITIKKRTVHGMSMSTNRTYFNTINLLSIAVLHYIATLVPFTSSLSSYFFYKTWNQPWKTPKSENNQKRKRKIKH